MWATWFGWDGCDGVLPTLIPIAHLHVYVPATVNNLPLWLDINGVLIVALFTVQALSGYRKFKLTRPQFLGLHSTIAWLIAIAAGVHAVLATVHLIIG